MGVVFYAVAIPTLILIGVFYLCFGFTKTLTIYLAYWFVLTFFLYGRKESALAAYGLTYILLTMPLILCYLGLCVLLIISLGYGIPIDFGLSFPFWDAVVGETHCVNANNHPAEPNWQGNAEHAPVISNAFFWNCGQAIVNGIEGTVVTYSLNTLVFKSSPGIGTCLGLFYFGFKTFGGNRPQQPPRRD